MVNDKSRETQPAVKTQENDTKTHTYILSLPKVDES